MSKLGGLVVVISEIRVRNPNYFQRILCRLVSAKSNVIINSMLKSFFF